MYVYNTIYESFITDGSYTIAGELNTNGWQQNEIHVVVIFAHSHSHAHSHSRSQRLAMLLLGTWRRQISVAQDRKRPGMAIRLLPRTGRRLKLVSLNVLKYAEGIRATIGRHT